MHILGKHIPGTVDWRDKNKTGEALRNFYKEQGVTPPDWTEVGNKFYEKAIAFAQENKTFDFILNRKGEFQTKVYGASGDSSQKL